MYPGRQADIHDINQPRTTVDARSVPKPKLAPASIIPNFLTQQSAREKRMSWKDFSKQLHLGQMVHVVTDGGANPSPGPAGWGEVLRQNEVCAFNFGHWNHATNNAMELRAVIEALRNLPNVSICQTRNHRMAPRMDQEWLEECKRRVICEPNIMERANRSSCSNEESGMVLREGTQRISSELVRRHVGNEICQH
jgi:ribonuclease HI